MSNVYACVPPIINRLMAEVPGLVFVGSFSELADFETIPPVPSIIVDPLGSVAPDDPHDGAFQMETQSWELILMVENLQTDGTVVKTTLDVAGELIHQIKQALVGWRPAPGYQTMAYRKQPRPHLEPGYGEFPIVFETGLIITGLGNG